MGVLVNYKIDLTSDEVLLIGTGLDLLPHGKVSALVRKVQAQIIEQELAAKAAVATGADASGAVVSGAGVAGSITQPKPNKGGRPRKLREVAVPIEAAVPFINGGSVSEGA